MGIKSAIGRLLGFSAETPPRPIAEVLLDMNSRGILPRAGRNEALSIGAVLKARNMICSIATLPLIQVDADLKPARLPLLEQIDPDVANVVTLAQTVEDLLFDAIAWWEILDFGADGYPTYAAHRDLHTVTLQPPGYKNPSPLPSGWDPRGATVWVDGRPVPADHMIRFDSPNPGLLHAGGRVIRRALLLDTTSALYADNPKPLDYFTPNEQADPADDNDIKALLEDWRRARKRGSTAYVPYAVTYNSVETPTPADLQLVELQKQVTLDIANLTGLDPEDLGVSTTSRTYQNGVDRRQDRINDTLSPYMAAIAQRLSMGDVTKRGYKVLHDLDAYLRADPKTRAEVYKLAGVERWLDDDEVRKEEGLPALTPAQRARMAPPPAPAAPAPGGNVIPIDRARNAMMAADLHPGGEQLRRWYVHGEGRSHWSTWTELHAILLSHGMGEHEATLTASAWYKERYGHMPNQKHARLAADEPDALLFSVDVQPIVSVDHERRIIEGIVLPYGPNKVAIKGGRRWRFQQYSLTYAEMRRVKLLRDHDQSQPLGKLVFAEDRPDGMFARYSVAPGPDGDRALAEAEHGIRDGFSVGVEIDDAEPDPLNQGVYLVAPGGAAWRETSILAVPAFDDARVTRVAATADQGDSMDTCATCGATLTQGVAHTCAAPPPPANTDPPPDPTPAVQLSNDQLAQLMRDPALVRALMGVPAPAAPAPETQQFALSPAQVTALLAAPGGREALLGLPAPEPRQTVDPTRRPSPVQVNEPAPYRFDRKGNLRPGRFDFSSDVIKGLRFGDTEALERAQTFVAGQFETFDTSMTNVAALNPNINRPDMYVDQKQFSYPIWDAINKGTLADMTPFVLPKFNTASGMVAAHTEGVEPSLGTFTATSQTITPSAVSGKVSITREAWDQGGNPQLSTLIWNKMVTAWYEALEAAAVALLEAASPTIITLTTGATDDALTSELERKLAALQFVRGGFRMRDLFGQVDLYSALVDATDAQGRKLLPMINPQNADGQANPLWGSLSIGGLLMRPSWALAASGSVSANSYLFDRSDVSGWATAPNRLTFENVEVRYVHIGIWGYKATAITDTTGVRRISYDPVP